MFITLKIKIWLAVLTIVLLFTCFTLFYFPRKQGQELRKSFNSEAQNLVKTVAMGVKIALREQNFEGVKTALEFCKQTPQLRFMSLIQIDTIWNEEHTRFAVRDTVLMTYPRDFRGYIGMVSNDSIIVKRAFFETSSMSGSIMGGFATNEIVKHQKRYKITSIIVSVGIFIIGLLIGLWLARNISGPVRALRDAARLVGKGDLSPVIKKFSRDEIGDLSKAFNTMVQDISKARDVYNTNLTLSESNALLNATLADLKATQAQLIQSEKMASLGELTAGIAHEIQNPLNFVNNFSEVNSELIAEMKQEIEIGNSENVKDLANSIDENEQKIIFHGKRADTIVKGMLQHSRSSSGVKEPTDINALANEYLRLAFHGLRAKDKSFNVNMKTDFDESLSVDPAGIGKVNVIPQDIGRVILNIIMNAFYAVTEKKKLRGSEYEPVVSVTTKKIGNKAEVRVKDNGNGVPQKILDKIFQPFFTTKPTGQGTGLGLSLSYDIVKAHGGELKVETKDGEGAEFIIQLPI